MIKSRYIFLVLLSILVLGCQQKTRQKQIPPTETSISDLTTASDSLTIDLIALRREGKLKNSIIVTVEQDPVYHSKKSYNAIPFSELLNSYPKIKKLQTDKYQIIFECEDGYKPMMPLQKFLSAKSFIAVSDVDAPEGESWTKIIKDGREMEAAPFYLIYQGISPKDTDFKWPYNLIKIHLVPSIGNVSLLYPKDDIAAKTGFDLFNKNCISCHAVNKIGGSMGPELNYPKSVTEYWNQEQLKKFIKNPASFRNGVKMPTIKSLTEKDIESIVYYLNYMANHKLQKSE
ncbi:MAG: cytochrome c2 [Ulvibacter sp.]|jgi:cytochrome c2